MKKYTKIKSMEIVKFRGIENLNIELADRVTLICGKNGTSKSTILGIIAQVFSFRKDYSKSDSEDDDLIKYKTLLGKNFESKFSEHFRFSSKFDEPSSMNVKLNVFDGIEDKDKNNLELKIYNSKDRNKARPILRGNKDRNITHPVIYLSVNRLTPIAGRKYELAQSKYLDDVENKKLALNLTNKILVQENKKIDITDGSIKSLAPHNDNYDYESISVGEDNVGQIVRALLSFKMLSEQYDNYSGGVLLIDEIDAGLFPAAQNSLFEVLNQYARKYNIQVIATTHSELMIKKAVGSRDKKNIKSIFLTNTYGKLIAKENLTYNEIVADLNVETFHIDDAINLPKINIYFEDQEARDFYKDLITKRKIKKVLNVMSEVNLGGDQYISLAKSKIPEFNKFSIIVLDGDKNPKKNNFICLPTNSPPDRLLYIILNDEKKESEFWRNEIGFTQSVFTKVRNKYLDKLPLGDEVDIEQRLKAFSNEGSNNHGLIRESFKSFYKDADVQRLIKSKKEYRPFRIWADKNEEEVQKFEKKLISIIQDIYINTYGINRKDIHNYFED